MRLVHLSDLHLGPPGALVEGLDPHARLAQALRHIADHHAVADRLVITGDLAHWGDPAAYDALHAALTGFPVPVRLMIGNHDDRATFLNAFPDQPRDRAGFVNHAEDLGGLRLIYCDTVEPRTHAGHFCAQRRDWLADQLAGCDRALVFFHHNPLHLGDPSTDMLSLNDADQAALRTILITHAHKIVHLCFGHVHEPLSGTLAGIAFSGVPSTLHQTLPSLAPSDTSPMAALEPSYRVLLLRGEDVVVHQFPFAFDGHVTQHANNWDAWAKPAD
ncbi:metallophosphoesterase [Thalassococcus sp. CAU 1522]|uniref:Metallophosphoesterase n=1 Tax=Thalassococcus arenae TaxID=2851652 RepID=A0ABS6N289_9RHOB|nr:metallophosphoesterase [Thalassococcus arenae]MBV2358150.1 metallophosphoesterase [Thalassococcus arenae]